MIAIRNINLVLQSSLIFDGVILIKDGVITEIGRADKITIPENCQVIDGGDLYLGPGLIDIHTHSGGGIWFNENPAEAAQANLRFGTTSVLPALYYNLDKEGYLQAIRKIKKASETPGGRNIRGIYLEGPYLNPKFGCEAKDYQWDHGIVEADYKAIVDEASDFAKVFCVAPEMDGIERYVEYVKSHVHNPVFAVAHSEASPDQVLSLVPQGLRLATHHTNATGDRVFYPEVRGVCVDEAVNYHRDIYAELICDEMGIHVDPFMLKLVRRIKGDDRIILISDAFVADGPVPDGYDGVTDINFDNAGEIAGSKMTLSQACKNIMRHTGAGLCDVFNFASTNPAKLINLTGRGEIKVGNIADLVMVDHKMTIKKVFLAGEQVYDFSNGGF